MAFKASKIEIYLTLDLTEFIPEDKGGILTTDKIDAESIFGWTKFTIAEGERITEIEKRFNRKEQSEKIKSKLLMSIPITNFEKQLIEDKTIIEDKVTITEATEESRKSVVKQIDYFYKKGEAF